MERVLIAATLGSPRPFTGAWPALLAAAVLASTTLLPPPAVVTAILAAIILLGVPHGALDGELARTALRPQVGRWWFLMFSGPYLLLAGLVMLAWQAVPLPTLAAFLLAASWHFGTEEVGSDDMLAVLAIGGLPIGAAVLTHPAMTATIFGVVAQAPLGWPPDWLQGVALGWLAASVLWTRRTLRRGEARRLAMPAAVLGGFALLPPLTAFAIYFICLHAPAHVRSVIADVRLAPRIRDMRSAIWLAALITLLTLLLGVFLWPLQHGPILSRLLCLTIQGLAALTLPHMLFDLWLRRASAEHRIGPHGAA